MEQKVLSSAVFSLVTDAGVGVYFCMYVVCVGCHNQLDAIHARRHEYLDAGVRQTASSYMYFAFLSFDFCYLFFFLAHSFLVFAYFQFTIRTNPCTPA